MASIDDNARQRDREWRFRATIRDAGMSRKGSSALDVESRFHNDALGGSPHPEAAESGMRKRGVRLAPPCARAILTSLLSPCN